MELRPSVHILLSLYLFYLLSPLFASDYLRHSEVSSFMSANSHMLQGDLIAKSDDGDESMTNLLD